METVLMAKLAKSRQDRAPVGVAPAGQGNSV